MSLPESTLLKEVERAFAGAFYARHRTKLQGGYAEPFYKAPSSRADGEIQFMRDHLRSALHETAHWCIAGPGRLRQDDWGYWYSPDGRTGEIQKKFYEVEVKPQALEWLFCDALGLPFEVSADNLDGSREGLDCFISNVEAQRSRYLMTGLPQRALKWAQALEGIRGGKIKKVVQRTVDRAGRPLL